MPLSNNESKNLERFLSSDDPSLQMMGLSMAKNLDLPIKFYSQISGLSLSSDEKEVRVQAASFVQKRLSLENREFTNLELISTANIQSFKASFLLIAEVNGIEALNRIRLFGSSHYSIWDSDANLDLQEARSAILKSSEEGLSYHRSEEHMQSMEVIFAIISQVDDKGINNFLYTKIRSWLSKSDRATFDKYFNFKYLLPGLQFTMNDYRLREHCGSAFNEMLNPSLKVAQPQDKSDKLGKFLSVCFMIYCAAESRRIEGINVAINRIKALNEFFTGSDSMPQKRWDSEEGIMLDLAERKLRELGNDAVPAVEKEFLGSETSDNWGMPFLKEFGSGFYRMKVSELDPELRKRGLKISGLRKEKIRRLVEFESFFGRDPRFGKSETELIESISSRNLKTALDSVEQLSFFPNSKEALTTAFGDKRSDVRHEALRSFMKVSSMSYYSDSETYKRYLGRLKDLKDENKFIRRGMVIATRCKNRELLFSDPDYGVRLMIIDNIVKSWNYNLPMSYDSGQFVPHNLNEYDLIVKSLEAFSKDGNSKCRKAAKVALEILHEAVRIKKERMSDATEKKIDKAIKKRNKEEFGDPKKCLGVVLQGSSRYPSVSDEDKAKICDLCCQHSYKSIFGEYIEHLKTRKNELGEPLDAGYSPSHLQLKRSCYDNYLNNQLIILVKDGIGYNLTKDLF